MDEQSIRDWEYEAAMREQQEAERIVEALSRFCNRGQRAEKLIAAMGREHRTLQQRMTEVMLQWFAHLDDLEPAWYDLRNEASVKAARVIMTALRDAGLAFEDSKGRNVVGLPHI